MMQYAKGNQNMNANRGARKAWVAGAMLSMGTVCQFGFVEGCDETLIEVTRIFDPCGTFLANCTPGSFETNAAPIGDYCVDPSCIVPGGCGNVDPPLGTIRDICP